MCPGSRLRVRPALWPEALRGAELGFVHREPAPAPLLHQGVPMQQWLNLVPMAGALLNLAAAMTNLAATVMNRRGTTSDRTDNDIAH